MTLSRMKFRRTILRRMTFRITIARMKMRTPGRRTTTAKIRMPKRTKIRVARGKRSQTTTKKARFLSGMTAMTKRRPHPPRRQSIVKVGICCLKELGACKVTSLKRPLGLHALPLPAVEKRLERPVTLPFHHRPLRCRLPLTKNLYRAPGCRRMK
jgi:hypothetical protein